MNADDKCLLMIPIVTMIALAAFALAIVPADLSDADDPTEYTVTVSVNPSNSGTVIGAGKYDAGTEATLQATGKEGYGFEKWDDGNTDNPRKITVTGDVTYTAVFKTLSKFDVTFLVSNRAYGSVSTLTFKCYENTTYVARGDEMVLSDGQTVRATPKQIDENTAGKFVKWNRTSGKIVEDTTFIAMFDTQNIYSPRDLESWNTSTAHGESVRFDSVLSVREVRLNKDDWKSKIDWEVYKDAEYEPRCLDVQLTSASGDSFKGYLTLVLYVGTGYEGKYVHVYHDLGKDKGIVECGAPYIDKGFIEVEVDSLSPFLVLLPKGQYISGITMERTNITIIKGETGTLKAKVLPNDAYDRSITWTSADPSVAQVDGNGTVSGISRGDTKVTATTFDGKYSVTCDVSVRNASTSTSNLMLYGVAGAIIIVMTIVIVVMVMRSRY